MIRPEPFHHDKYFKYVEDNRNRNLITSYLLLYISKEPRTIPQISVDIVNPPERLQSNRTKYDANALVKKMSSWGYLQPEQNMQKYRSKILHWSLTEKGRDLLKRNHVSIAVSIKEYYNLYTIYEENGYAPPLTHRNS